jgi:hypothetical protein
MRDLTEKQFVAAMARNGFNKDDSTLNGFRHPDLAGVMFMMMIVQARGHRSALKFALERVQEVQAEKAKT